MRRLARRRRVAAELDPRAADPQHRAARPEIESSSSRTCLAAEQVARDVREQRRLALALLRLGRAPPHAVGEQADRDGDDDVDAEREPVRAVRRA